jgi:hypothetical protein
MTAVGSAFCIRCGKQIVAGASFCSVCGGSQTPPSLSETAVAGGQAPVGAYPQARVWSALGAQPLAGVLAIIGAVGMVPAMLMPLIHYQYPASSQFPASSFDAVILYFDQNHWANDWDAIGHGLSAVIALVVGFMLLTGAMRSKLGAGLLLAIGLTQFCFFGSYFPWSAFYSDPTISLGPAPFIGVAASVALLLGGLVTATARE